MAATGDLGCSLCCMDDPMHEPPPDPSRAARVARWLQPSPPELAGLAVLVLGAVVASGLMWFQAAQRPSELGSGAATAGVAVAADLTTDGPAPGVTDEPTPGPHDLEGYATDAGDQAGAGHAGGPGSVASADVTEATEATEATVHVTGAVANPGLVVVPVGSRVGDAVAAAGGLAGGAQDERINLARPVVDGEHVHVPREGEELPPAGSALGGPALGGAEPGGVVGGAGPVDGRVDINRAGAAELETLPGIGPARAEQIVAHREQHGPFAAPGDLRAVSGIGEVIFQGLAELVTVG